MDWVIASGVGLALPLDDTIERSLYPMAGNSRSTLKFSKSRSLVSPHRIPSS
jgi:hypothetical protein